MHKRNLQRGFQLLLAAGICLGTLASTGAADGPKAKADDTPAWLASAPAVEVPEGQPVQTTEQAALEVSAWQCMKIGAGPVPIETSEGWLLFYHGVLRSCNGYVYAFSSALLDLEEPWKVVARSGPYLISPRELYECTGDVPNVTFPCAALHDPATGRVAVYYGCADTVTGLAFGYIPEIVAFTKKNSIL